MNPGVGGKIASTIAWAIAAAAAAVTLTSTAHATDFNPRKTLPSQFDQLVAPAELRSSAPAASPAQFNVQRRFEDDALGMTGSFAVRLNNAVPGLGADWNTDVSLAKALALKVRMRYSDSDAAPLMSSFELSYRPERSSAPSATLTLDKRVARMNLDVPLLPKRLSTSFELQYIGATGAVIGEQRNDLVIGNLTLAGTQISSGTRVTVGMRNVFGAQATGTNSQMLALAPTDGRSVRLDFTRKL